MKRIILIFGLSIVLFGFAQAQISSDALLMSDHSQLTTARSLGVSGAMSALGGDMTALNNNPAGIGVYRSSEFLISPGLQFSTIRSTFVSDSLRPLSINSRSAFNFGGIGLVFSDDLSGDWKNINFGLSYNRIASFNRTHSFSGVSTGSRLVNFVQEANNSNSLPDNLDPFEEQLAWDAFMIDNPGGGTTYVGAAIDSNYIKKSQLVRQSGGVNELGISLGGNYLNKFYIGGTLGIDFIKLRDIRDYSETELSGNTDYKSMRFNEERNVNGVGVNLKLGIIYRINKMFRMGLAVHTPTAYSLTEKYETSLSGAVIWNDTLIVTPDANPKLSPTGEFKHNFYSPWLFNFSLGMVLGNQESKNKGFIGLEGEYLNYSAGNFSLKSNDLNITVSDQEYINRVNSAIVNNYQGAARIKLGGELAMSNLRLRAGYRVQTSPFQQPIKGVSDLRHDISMGIGIRTDDFFVDLAYAYRINQFEYAPYYATSELNNPRTVNDMNGGLLLLSFGLRF